MLPWGPPDIKLSIETQKSPFGDIGNLTKMTHDPIPPYHRGVPKMIKQQFLSFTSRAAAEFYIVA